MNRSPGHLWRGRLAIGLIGILGLLATSRRAMGYTPESPEVREMLSKACVFLKGAALDLPDSMKLGGQALVALAVYKYEKRFGQGGKTLPPITARVLAKVLQAARDPKSLAREDNYSVGIALIFLTEVHPARHIEGIQAFFDEMRRRQKPGGGWGYRHSRTGDTSQTQYAVLGAWAAKTVARIDVPRDYMVQVANWLMRTQDPSGAWGYQGRDPGVFTRVPQSEIRPSLAAAGLGSVYVAAHFLGMGKGRKRKKGLRKLPPALIPVKDESEKQRIARGGASLDVGRVRQSLKNGNTWFKRNFTIKTARWQFYYIYGLERYESFREMVDGTYEEEPRWYNEGVRFLAGVQSKTGAFGIQSQDALVSIGTTDEEVRTAFACLFLLRSTQATLAEVMEREGILRGGYGLPGDLTEVRLRGNKIVAPAITGKVEDLVSMLEDEEGDKIENMLDNPDALSLSGLAGSGGEYTARLWRVLRTGSYKARIVAAHALGSQGDLDNVPILIYALTDGDPRVVREARDGLWLTSRKFGGFGLPDSPTKAQLKTAIERWKNWYRSIRSDAVFIE